MTPADELATFEEVGSVVGDADAEDSTTDEAWEVGAAVDSADDSAAVEDELDSTTGGVVVPAEEEASILTSESEVGCSNDVYGQE